MDFDALSSYPSAMLGQNSVYPKIEGGFCFKPDMKNAYVEEFKNQTFNQDGNESAVLRIKYYKPPDLIFQNLQVTAKVKTTKVNRRRNGFIVDTLTSVDFCESVKMGEKVIRIYEGVIYQENFMISPFRKVTEKIITLRQKNKDEKMI